MAKENVKLFYEKLAKDKELQKKIAEAQKNYKGDTSDKDAAANEILIPLAKEAGYEITVEDIYAFERDEIARRGISEEELEKVSGGTGACFIIGFGGVSGCLIYGDGVDLLEGDDQGINGGVYGCVGLGIGFGVWD